MRRLPVLLGLLALPTIAALTGCEGDTSPLAPSDGAGAAAAPSATTASDPEDSAAFGRHRRSGAVYTMSNDASGNEIVSMMRASDGALTPGPSFPTGGLGTGAGLGNQGGLRGFGGEGRRYLVVCNAGSNEISVLAERRGGDLHVVEVAPSGGEQPISVTVDGNLVYVLNAGGDGNVTGFRFHGGRLRPIRHSTRPLSDAGVGPAQVELSPHGRVLAVTEKGTNRIVTYLMHGGRAGNPIVNDSVGQTPFGFAFDRSGRHVIVSEAFGGGTDQSAVSSYEVEHDGTLSPVTSSLPTTETAACWIGFAGRDRYAYTTNAGSGTITGYREDRWSGRLTILDADGVTANVGPDTTPLDLAAAGRDDKYLYVLAAGSHEVAGYEVDGDGSLTPINRVGDLPDASNGLVAW